MDIKKLWDPTEAGGYHFDDDLEFQQSKFISTVEGEAITKTVTFFIKQDALDLATSLAEILGTVVTGRLSNTYLLSGSMKLGPASKPCLVWVKGSSPYSDEPVCTWVTASGHHKVVEEILKIAEENSEVVRRGSVRWWYKTTNGITHHDVSLNDDQEERVLPEFYPALKGGPFQFIEEYLNSDASVWVLGGVPGTGKTTLLRKMITYHKLQAQVVYDAQLMADETVLQQFLFSDSKVIIFEDAENMILPRLNGNEAMSKFLNASNGLVKLPKKKIVFTTNYLNPKKIDEGLKREGRCFAVTSLEPLNHEQAILACKVGNMKPPTDPKGTYTLAQLFNPR